MYKENGYADRADYLRCMAEDYDMHMDTVVALANILGPDEDFDGLVVALEDEAERQWDE